MAKGKKTGGRQPAAWTKVSAAEGKILEQLQLDGKDPLTSKGHNAIQINLWRASASGTENQCATSSGGGTKLSC